MKFILAVLIMFSMMYPVFADSLITFTVNNDKLIPGEIVELNGKVPSGMEEKPVGVEIKDSEGKVILIRTITSDTSGTFILKFKIPNDVSSGPMDVVTNIEIDGQTFSDTKTIQIEQAQTQEPEPELSSEPTTQCGPGTELKDGVCVIVKSTPEKKGGGCLIATATYGSELAPQVQQLRELRDNQLLQTSSGTSFMIGFNQLYYSFSPAVADWERESNLQGVCKNYTNSNVIFTISSE